MGDSDYDIPNDDSVSASDIHPGTELVDTDFSDADLRGADLTDADLQGADLTDAKLGGTNLTDANLEGADLSEATLQKADLTDANLGGADLSEAYLYYAVLSGAYLENADLPTANLWGADCTGAYLMSTDLTGTNLSRADLTNADLNEADLSEANLQEADLTDANLSKADMTDADLERATLVGTELFDTDLTRIRPYGARITDVQINDGTEMDTSKSENASWWQQGPLAPAPRCGYDFALRAHGSGEDASDEDTDREELLSKAADTYKEFEELAHDNTRPSLESSMFVRRQEMQRARYWERGEYLPYAFAVVSGSVFKYGESLARVLLSAVLIIVTYAVVYGRFDLIIGADGFIESPVDALYFSTLTFTTLGLGDYQPNPASELARVLVTSQAALGAVLIAIFVFVLGRRAAR